MAIANNDLIEVITSYTTPGTTLNVLATFRPRATYNPQVWRLKAIKETRGLVVDDAVAGTSLGDRFKYYLVVNTTLHGNLKDVNSRGMLSDYNIGEGVISSITATTDDNTESYYIQQDANYDLTITDNYTVTVPRTYKILVKIINAIRFEKAVLLLGEYGDIHILTSEVRGVDSFSTIIRGYGFVSMQATSNQVGNFGTASVQALARNGNVYMLQYNIDNNKVTYFAQMSTQYNNKIVQLHWKSVLTRSGKIVNFSSKYIGDIGHAMYGRYVYDHIDHNYNVDARGLENTKVVMYLIDEHNLAYVSPDRTLHMEHTQFRGIRVVHGTEHVTQRIYLNEKYGTLRILIDVR